MNKRTAILTLAIFALLAAPLAQAALVSCGQGGTPCRWADLIKLINTVINFLIFGLGVPLATLVVVVSGIELVLHPNDSTARSVWKDRLMNGLIGFLIILAAYLIVKVVIFGLTDTADIYKLRQKIQ
jgi:hypothetical protein